MCISSDALETLCSSVFHCVDNGFQNRQQFLTISRLFIGWDLPYRIFLQTKVGKVGYANFLNFENSFPPRATFWWIKSNCIAALYILWLTSVGPSNLFCIGFLGIISEQDNNKELFSTCRLRACSEVVFCEVQSTLSFSVPGEICYKTNVVQNVLQLFQTVTGSCI